MLYHFSLAPSSTNFPIPSNNSHVKTTHKLILMSPTEDAFCVRLRSCLSCEAYCVCIACCMMVGCARRVWGGEKKVLMDELKEKHLIGMWGGGMICCMSGLSPSSVTKHTQTSLCHLWVGVCLYIGVSIINQQDLQRIKPINENPFLRLVSWLFLVYWLIIWSLLFSLWTSKPLEGALDNSSLCSACPPCFFNEGSRSLV